MTAQDIARGLGARRSGNGWMAKCPAHTDKTPSLRISEGRIGPLVHCHTGCDKREVIKALHEMGLWEVQDKPKVEFDSKRYRDAKDWRMGMIQVLNQRLVKCSAAIEEAAARDEDPAEIVQRVCRESTDALRRLMTEMPAQELIAAYDTAVRENPELAQRCITATIHHREYGRKVIHPIMLLAAGSETYRNLPGVIEKIEGYEEFGDRAIGHESFSRTLDWLLP